MPQGHGPLHPALRSAAARAAPSRRTACITSDAGRFHSISAAFDVVIRDATDGVTSETLSVPAARGGTVWLACVGFGRG